MGPGTARAQYETVVVAPRATEQAQEDQAASSSVITADRTPRAGEDLPQLLSELPGVSVTRFGGLGATATLSLRGSAPNQVAVYVDGVPLNSATWGSVDVGSLPVAGIDRIEVYRGMSPTSFGGSAIGGIVSLSSRVPTEDRVVAYAGGGSFGTGSGGAEASWRTPALHLLAAVNYLGSRGDFIYYDPNNTTTRTDDGGLRRRENNALAQVDGLLRAVAPLAGRRELMSTLSFLSRTNGLAPPPSFMAHGASLATRRLLASAVYSSRDDLGPGGRLRLTGYGSTTEEHLGDLFPEYSLAPSSTRDRNDSVGATATGSRPIGRWLRLGSTLDARREVFMPFDALSTAATALPSTRSFGAVAAEAQLVLGTLELLPSARLEAAHDEIVDLKFNVPVDLARPATYLIPVARLGLLQHQRPWLTLRANAGRYGRMPTMFERYGNAGLFLGNTTLVPETGLNADLGATAALGAPQGWGLTIDTAVFGTSARQLIEFQQGRNYERAINIGRARILGAELALAGRLGRYGRLSAQGTFTDARDRTVTNVAHFDRILPQRPRLRAYARPELRRLPLPWRWRLGAYGDVDVTSGNYLNPANTNQVRRRILFGAGASAESPAGRWRLVASAQNLGDIDLADLFGLPQPRRSFFLTLQWSSSRNSPTEEIVP
jgi:outer membrane cobalamin receptor